MNPWNYVVVNDEGTELAKFQNEDYAKDYATWITNQPEYADGECRVKEALP